MDTCSGSIGIKYGMQGIALCTCPGHDGLGGKCQFSAGQDLYDYEIDSDYSEESDDTAGREFMDYLRERMRTPPPVKTAFMGTVEVTTTPDLAQAGQRRVQIASGVFQVRPNPSPPQPQPSTTQPAQRRVQIASGVFQVRPSPSPPQPQPSTTQPAQRRVHIASGGVYQPKPSPAQAQSNTLQATPEMVHVLRAVSLRPLEKQPRIGTGRVIPKKFVPPHPRDMPQMLFPLTDHRGFTSSPVPRFVRRDDPRQFLIYTDGACSDNGGFSPRGGCAFVYRTSQNPSSPSPKSTPEEHGCFPLEGLGPTGVEYMHTSNRAELRAVIAALRFRSWNLEGFNCLVIATDSEYVVNGITSWIKAWRRKDWRTRSGTVVKNKDLWQCLLGEIERADENGLRVQFWRISRDWNIEADHHAKQAVRNFPLWDFADTIGVFS